MLIVISLLFNINDYLVRCTVTYCTVINDFHQFHTVFHSSFPFLSFPSTPPFLSFPIHSQSFPFLFTSSPLFSYLLLFSYLFSFYLFLSSPFLSFSHPFFPFLFFSSLQWLQLYDFQYFQYFHQFNFFFIILVTFHSLNLVETSSNDYE